MVSFSAQSEELETFLAAPTPGECLGIDCEFEFRSTRWPVPSTLQLTRNDKTLVYDVYAGEPANLTSLLDDFRLILFACSQDLMVLQSLGCLADTLSKEIVDLQTADALLDRGHGRGLATIIDQDLGHSFDSQEQKSKHWLKRPLTDSQVEYAATGSQYLLELNEKYQQMLTTEGKRDWCAEQCSAAAKSVLMRDALQDKAPQTRGRALQEWVFRIADHLDKPPSWILPRDTYGSVIENPKTLPVHLKRKDFASKAEIQHIVGELRALPVRSQTATPSQSLIQRVQSFGRSRAKELQVHPALATSKPLATQMAKHICSGSLAHYLQTLPTWQQEHLWQGVEGVKGYCKGISKSVS